MIINEKQLEVLCDFAMECHEGYGHEVAKFYFYQDEEHKDSAISMHVHSDDTVSILSVDCYGSTLFESWY